MDPTPSRPHASSPNVGFMSENHHWLRKVAHHAGLELELPSNPDIGALREAWPRVVRACRMADDRFTQKVASHFRIGVADVSTYDPQAVRLIPEAIARRHGILAMSSTESTVVSISAAGDAA